MSLLPSIAASSMINRLFKKIERTMTAGYVPQRVIGYDKAGSYTYVSACGYGVVARSDYNITPIGSMSSLDYRGATIYHIMEEHGDGLSNAVISSGRVDTMVVRMGVPAALASMIPTIFERIQIFYGSTVIYDQPLSAGTVTTTVSSDGTIHTAQVVWALGYNQYILSSGASYTVRFVYKS